MSLTQYISEAISDYDFDYNVKDNNRLNKHIVNKVDYIYTKPEFKKWFGNSQATLPNGKPIIFYHGTNAEFDVFQDGKGKTPFTFFTSDFYEASRYGDTIKACVLKVNNLYDIYNDKEEQQYLLSKFDDIVLSLTEEEYQIVFDNILYFNDDRNDMGLPPLPTDVITKEYIEHLLNHIDAWSIIETPFVINRIKELNYEGFISTESGNFNIGLFSVKNKAMIISNNIKEDK
jgi:hypothetical protein